MLKGHRIGRSVVLNWLALAISIGVAFFLSPFIVHRLGNIAYGIWTLVNSMIAYMGLLDLGMRGAVTRFVSRHHSQGEHLASSRAVSAAFWLRATIGFAVLCGALILPSIAISIFDIPADMQMATRLTLGVVGASFAVTLTFGVFGGVLAALQRFDLISGVGIVQTLFRAGGAIWLLKSGHGIVSLAVWELIVVVLANIALTTLALRVYRDLQLLIRPPDSATLRQLWGFGAYLLLVNMCGQVIYYTDNLVVGAFVSAGAVTFFTIAGGLIEYARQVVAALGGILFSLASSLEAKGQETELRYLLIQGTRATLLVGLPIQVALFFGGRTFIGLWVGQEYAAISGRILQILLVAQVFAIANYTSFNIVCGLEKHKPVALVGIAEASANLILSIVLVRRIGLEGVAWGTVIPSIVIHLSFWPRYICRTLRIRIRDYVWQAWIRSALAVAPFGLACYLADRFWVASSMFYFFIHIAVLCSVLLAGIAVSFADELYKQLRGSSSFNGSLDVTLGLVKRTQ